MHVDVKVQKFLKNALYACSKSGAEGYRPTLYTRLRVRGELARDVSAYVDVFSTIDGP